MAEKKKFDLTETWSYVTDGTVDMQHLNPLEWLRIISMSLDACKIVLRQVAENNRKARLFEALINHPLDNGVHNEKRITPKEVVGALPKSLLINDKWLFIPVKTLETKEEKGQFFERRLLILADFAVMIIMDTWYRKEPIPDQNGQYNPPKINEQVVNCKILASQEILGLSNDGFEEVILPYLEDSELKLGKLTIRYVLKDAVEELKKAKERVVEIEESMKPFLLARERMGIINIL